MQLLKHTKYYIFAFSLFFSLQCFAQEVDHGIWTSVELQKKWKNGIALSFDEDYRLRENAGTTDKFMTTLDLSYKPFSFIKAGASYCLINYNHPGKEATKKKPAVEEYWERRHRYSLYIQGQYEFNRFQLSLKERYQSTYRVGVAETADRANPKELLRSKLELSYDVKGFRLSPYVYCELQHALNAPVNNYGLVEARYSAGLQYEILDGLSVECGYLYDVDKEDLVNAHVLTFGLEYSF